MDITKFSPTSRRRYQKRLYMRRKRAEAKGIAASSEVGRLKPGRKALKNRKRASKTRASDADLVSTPSAMKHGTDVTANSSEAEDTTFIGDASPGRQLFSSTSRDSSQAPPQMSGTTFPYRTKTEMLDLGLDAAALREEGFHLFHLSKFHKLMK